jgi:predicted DCC family thiol-disulfide oxidoreductase YuxK
MGAYRMMPPSTATDVRRIVLYDGLCGMCDGVVQFLLRHDRNNAFQFAPQQGEVARQIVERHAIAPEGAETIFVIDNYDSPRERVCIKSDAVLLIAKGLGGIWTLALAAHLLPRSIRDAFYDLIARNRYKFSGRRNACRIPDPEVQHRFLR